MPGKKPETVKLESYHTFYSGVTYPGVYPTGFKFKHPNLGDCEIKASFIGRLYNDIESLYYVVAFSKENWLCGSEGHDTAYVSRLIISPIDIDTALGIEPRGEV